MISQTELFDKIQNMLKIILRIAFTLIIVTYVGYGCLYIIRGGEPFLFAGYIPIYAFIHAQLPAFCLMAVMLLYRTIRRQEIRSFFKTEFWFSAGSVMALVFIMLAMLIVKA